MDSKLIVAVCAALLAGAIEARDGSMRNGSGARPVPPPPTRADTAALPANLKLSAELIAADGVVPDYLTVIPKGLHIAYITSQGSLSVAVVDGKTGPAF